MFDIAQKMITALDVIAMNLKSVDEISPVVRDIQTALKSYPNLPASYEGKAKIDLWCDTLKNLNASDEITDEQARQLKFDLENALSEFNEKLRSD